MITRCMHPDGSCPVLGQRILAPAHTGLDKLTRLLVASTAGLLAALLLLLFPGGLCQLSRRRDMEGMVHSAEATQGEERERE